MSCNEDVGELKWEPRVDRRFKETWKQILEEGMEMTTLTERTAALRQTVTGDTRKKSISTTALQWYEPLSFKDEATKEQSLLGWAAEQEDTEVVMSIRKEDCTVVGWAMRKRKEQEGSSAVSSIRNNRDTNDLDEIEVFATKCRDVLDLRLHEVPLVSERVTASPALQHCVNQVSVRRYVVGVLFADLYANCFLVADFIIATDSFLKSDDFQAHEGTTLLLVTVVYLCIRELVQISSEYLEYLCDPWNILDLCRAALVTTSAVLLRTGSAEKDTVQSVLMVTSLFLFGGVISFLRSAFLPFSKFVYGVQRIFVALLPFLVITGVVLLGFGYMYWVRNFSCPEPKCDIVDGFYSAYALLVGGPEHVEDVLDIVAGFVLVVILLNVVIAIVTKAWEATDEDDVIFWRHRISFLIELPAFLRQVQFCQQKRTGKKDENQCSAVDNVGLEIDHQLEEISYRLDRSIPFGVRMKLLCFAAFYRLVYVCMIVLGLVTFGIFWPRRIREIVFGMNSTTKAPTWSDQEEVISSLKQDIQRLQDSTEPLHALMKELSYIKKGIEEIQQEQDRVKSRSTGAIGGKHSNRKRQDKKKPKKSASKTMGNESKHKGKKPDP